MLSRDPHCSDVECRGCCDRCCEPECQCGCLDEFSDRETGFVERECRGCQLGCSCCPSHCGCGDEEWESDEYSSFASSKTYHESRI